MEYKILKMTKGHRDQENIEGDMKELSTIPFFQLWDRSIRHSLSRLEITEETGFNRKIRSSS
jgi:hypothetical protein